MRGWAHLFVDVENPTVRADIERPSRGERLVLIDDSVRRRHFLRRIAQQGIVGAQRLREGLVRLGRVDADREVRDVEGADGIAALTERLAFRRSATGERFGEPGKDHRLLAFVVGEPVPLAVGPHQGEGRSRIANFEVTGGGDR